MATVVPAQFIRPAPYQPTRKDYLYQALGQGLQSLVGGALKGQQRRLTQQDISAFQAYNQYQQQLQQAGGLQQPAFQQRPVPQSQIGQQMAMQGLMGQMFGQGQAPTIGGLRARQAVRTGAVPGSEAFEDIAGGPTKPPKPTRSDMKFYLDRDFTPSEAKMMQEDYLGKRKEPQTQKEIATELSKWQTIQNKTRAVGFGGQLGEIEDQETWDLAKRKISNLRGRLEEKKQKSPYPEYPNAFLEGGIWKVMRGGKKYRVED